MGTRKLYHGYVVFCATFVLSVASIGVFNASSLFLDPLKRTFKDDPLAVALMPFWITIQVVVGLAASMGGGPVQDWLSEVAGLNMPLQFALLGGGSSCLGFWLSSAAGSIWTLLAGSVLLGIGIGFFGFISAGICVLWFDENRGTMLLLALSGRGLGSMATSILIANLLDAFGDADDAWRPAMRVVGGACLVVGAAASLGMRLPRPGEVEAHEAGPGGLFDAVDDDEEASALLAGQEKYGTVTPVPSPTPSPQLTPSPKLTPSPGRVRFGGLPPSGPSMTTSFSGRSKRSSVAVLSQMRNRRRTSAFAATSILGGGAAANGGGRPRPRHQTMFSRPGMVKDLSVKVLNTSARVLPTGRNNRRSSVAEFKALAFAPIDFSTDPCHDDVLDSSPDGPDCKEKASFNDVLFSRTSILLNLWSLITSFAFLNLQVYVPGYVSNSLGLPSSISGTAMTAFGLGLLLANLTLGPLTDCMGAQPMLFCSMMGLAVMDYLWPLCRTALSIEAVTGVYGFLTATNGTLPLIIVADAFGDVPPNFILMLNGVLNVTKCPGFLFGPTLAAAFRSGPYDYASIATASWIALVVGNVFLIGIPSPDAEGEEEEEDGKGAVLNGAPRKLSAVEEI